VAESDCRRMGLCWLGVAEKGKRSSESTLKYQAAASDLLERTCVPSRCWTRDSATGYGGRCSVCRHAPLSSPECDFDAGDKIRKIFKKSSRGLN
jgi:hypothetical protein